MTGLLSIHCVAPWYALSTICTATGWGIDEDVLTLNLCSMNAAANLRSTDIRDLTRTHVSRAFVT